MNIVVVLIWDVFRAPQEIADRLAEIVTRGKIHTMELRKPWGCSLCMTFWLSLVLTYIFCERSIDGFLVATLLSLFNAFMTKYTYAIITTTELVIDKIIYYVNKYIQ